MDDKTRAVDNTCTVLLRVEQFIVGKKFLFFTLFYSFLLFSPFLREHWTHDSYCVSMFGYNYMTSGNRLLQQGRPFSYLFYRLLDVLNLPYDAAMTLSVSATLVFLSLVVYLIYTNTDKYINYDSLGKYAPYIALIGSFSVFFNMFLPDSMLFFENGVMSLGILFTIIASCLFCRNDIITSNIKRFTVCLLFLLMGSFCYQSDIAYFLPFVIVLLYTKHHDDIKGVIKKFIPALFIYVVTMTTNYLFVRILSNILNSGDSRITGEIDLLANIRRSILRFITFAINHFGFTPKFLFTFVIFVLLVVCIYPCIKKRHIHALIMCFMAFSALIICTLLPHIAMGHFYMIPRSAVAMSGIGGLIILCGAICQKKHSIVMFIVCSCYLFFVSQCIIDIQKNTFAANLLDQQEIAYIINGINDYEANYDDEIEHVYISFADTSSRLWYRSEITKYEGITNRILTSEWMLHAFLIYHIDRTYPVMYLDYNAFEQALYTANSEEGGYISENRGLDGALYTRLVIFDRALYICIY